ncbi:MAG: hypothetical protein RL461_1690 [Planctomycetota bacterium]
MPPSGGTMVQEARGHERINVQMGRLDIPHPVGEKAEDFDFGCGERGMEASAFSRNMP